MKLAFVLCVICMQSAKLNEPERRKKHLKVLPDSIPVNSNAIKKWRVIKWDNGNDDPELARTQKVPAGIYRFYKREDNAYKAVYKGVCYHRHPTEELSFRIPLDGLSRGSLVEGLSTDHYILFGQSGEFDNEDNFDPDDRPLLKSAEECFAFTQLY